jgi:cell division protein ZapB
MELLDLLESRMDSLVREIEFLRKENLKLREDASSGLAALTEENSYLKQALEEEQQLKDAVLKRVDGLLTRLQSVAAAGVQ